MALINREQALSHPFANGQYDKEHADEHFIMGFEDYKEWLENLPTVEAIPKSDYEARLKADMVAMLEDLDLQIDESTAYNTAYNSEVEKVHRLIRDRINALRGNE